MAYLREKDAEASVSECDVFDNVWMDNLELCQKIRARLLEKGFQVQGLRPGSHEEVTINPRLLEILQPIVETCELIEVGDFLAGRRFEHVRVFKTKGAPGKRPSYDWRGIAQRVRRQGIIYPTNAKLVAFCRENVLLVSGEKPDQLPDDKTTREAIAKQELWEFSQQKGKRPGK
jgi:hypothetical protein